MKTHLRATAHLYLLAALVAVLLSVAMGCAGLAEAVGTTVGAAGGAVAGGPVGAAGGALAGKGAANLIVPPPPQETSVTNIDAKPGSTVNVAAVHAEKPWYEPWLFWLKVALAALALLLAIPRTRPHVLGFLYSAVLGHGKSALAKAGAALGVVHSATADTALTAARKRRGKVPPAVVVSTEQKPHA